MEFKITTEYIELIKLLKVLGIAETGGHAKAIVEEGEVKYNGAVDFRKRLKVRPGDKIEVDGETITIL